MSKTLRPVDSGEPLDRGTLRRIAEALKPIAPGPDRAARMRGRVLDAVRTSGRGDSSMYLTVRATEGAWVEIAPLVQRKRVYRDRTGEAYLLRLLPGAVLAGHDHPAHEECVVLEGETFLGDIRLAAGDFHLARADTDHGVVRSPKGALLYVRTVAIAP